MRSTAGTSVVTGDSRDDKAPGLDRATPERRTASGEREARGGPVRDEGKEASWGRSGKRGRVGEEGSV
jgi:hypothetical protein